MRISDWSSDVCSSDLLEFGEGHLDRIHVRAVGRQVKDLGAAGGDRLADPGNLVSRQVVEHDDIAALERGCENLTDIDPEGIAIHRPVEHTWRGHAREAQPGDTGHRRPVTDGAAVGAAHPW